MFEPPRQVPSTDEVHTLPPLSSTLFVSDDIIDIIYSNSAFVSRLELELKDSRPSIGCNKLKIFIFKERLFFEKNTEKPFPARLKTRQTRAKETTREEKIIAFLLSKIYVSAVFFA